MEQLRIGGQPKNRNWLWITVGFFLLIAALAISVMIGLENWKQTHDPKHVARNRARAVATWGRLIAKPLILPAGSPSQTYPTEVTLEVRTPDRLHALYLRIQSGHPDFERCLSIDSDTYVTVVWSPTTLVQGWEVETGSYTRIQVQGRVGSSSVELKLDPVIIN